MIYPNLTQLTQFDPTLLEVKNASILCIIYRLLRAGMN